MPLFLLSRKIMPSCARNKAEDWQAQARVFSEVMQKVNQGLREFNHRFFFPLY